jgi:hypothetical protein
MVFRVDRVGSGWQRGRMLNSPLLLSGLLVGFGVFATTASAQELKPAGKPNFPEALPGRGLAQHDLRSWKNPNLGPATTIQLLDAPESPENAHFGSIR